jgi:hypothetical protein
MIISVNFFRISANFNDDFPGIHALQNKHKDFRRHDHGDIRKQEGPK